MANSGRTDTSSLHPATDDPAVGNPACLAFQLGWDMGCLYRQAKTLNREREFRTHRVGDETVYPKLPAQGEFTGGQRTKRRIVAVSAGLFRLSGSFERSGFEAPTVEPVRAAFEGGDRGTLKEAAFKLHVSTLLLLQASDPRLGSAYNLGRALMATGSARSVEDLKERFRYQRVNGLCDELDDLVSALPTHVGRAVGTSLCWWQRALAPRLKGQRPGQPLKLASRLDRQAELWRALLSGEKHAPDVLGARDYTNAAGRLLGNVGSIAKTVAREHRLGLAGLLATIVGGVVLAVAAGGVEGTLVAITGIAAAFGISWRGVGVAVGGVARQLQGPLWHAELDFAIAEAITDSAIRKAYDRLPERERRYRAPG